MAAGVEIGTGYISIVPSLKGFTGRVQQEVGGSLDSAGKESGGRFSRFFSNAASVATGMAMAKGGAAIGGLFSTAVSKGLGRLEAIDTAQGKLRGLGKDAGEVDAIMASALASVKGTAFGLGDAATVAASTVAAGVKPGRDLERTLKLVGDAATIGGSSMGEMGSIFNKVAASNKIQMGEMNQLMDRGIPVQQMLADHLNVSVEEVGKLASAGKIDFATFQAAMEKGLGGAALESGKTFRGALDNVNAAIGRLGADVMGPVFQRLPAVFGAAIGVLDKMSPAAKRVGEALGQAFDWAIAAGKQVGDAIQGVYSILNSGDFTGGIFGLEEDSAAVGALFAIRDAITTVRDASNQLWSGLTMPASVQAEFAASGEPLMGLVKVGTEIRNFFTGLWGNLGAKVVEFGAGFVAGFGGLDAVFSVFKDLLPVLMGPLGILRSALMEVFGSGGISGDAAGFGQTLGSALAPVLTLLGELAGMITGLLAGALAELLPVLLQVGQTLLSALAPVLMQIVPIIAQLATTLLPVFASLFQSLIPVVMQLVSAILPLVAMLVAQLAPVLLNIVSALLPPLGLLLQAVASVIGTLVQALAPVIAALVGALAPIITTLVQALLPPLARVIAMVAEVIATILAPILNVIINVLGVLLVGAINALMPVVTVVFNFIARTIGNVMNFVSGIIRLVMAVIRGDWSGAWNAIQQIGAAVWNQIRNIISTAIGLVMAVIRGVLTTIQTIWNAAWEVIKGVAQAAWDWINRGITAFGDGARNLFQGIVDGIGRIWAGLRDIAARPVRFIVDTIINGGLIKGWNDLVGLLGLPANLRIAPLNVPGFRKGGFTGRGRDDEWAGGVHRNEFVMDASTVRAAGGPSNMDVLRDRLRTGAWPVGPRAETPGMSQNTTIVGLPIPAIAGLPTDVRKLAKRGPQPGDDGIGGPVDWGMGRVGSYGWYRRCLAFVNAAWGYGVGRFRLATARQSQNAGPRTMTGTPPAGAGVYWDTGGYAGHISLAVGDGTELSNDIIVPGRIDRVQSRAFRDRWGARYMGWWHPGGAAGGPGGPGPDGGGPSLAEMIGGWLAEKITDPVKALIARIPGVGKFVDLAGAVGIKLADVVVDKLKDLAGFASGTASAPPGLAWVGERGPELVAFRGGERVWSNRESMRRTSGTDRPPINVYALDPFQAAQRVSDELRWARGA